VEPDLDLDELARRAGVAPSRVRSMVELGILGPGPQGAFAAPDIQRVRIVEAMDGSGIRLEQVAEMIERGEYSTGWADLLFPEPVPMSERTLKEAVAELGLPLDLVHRMYTVAWQLPVPAEDDQVREDDLELLRMAALAYWAFGTNVDQVIAAARYFGDNMRRVAESQMRFFREAVEEPLIAAGGSQREVMDRVTEIGIGLLPVGFRIAEILHRRHLEHYEIEDIVTNTEIAMEQAGLVARRPESPPTIAFLDLSGYTALTEERGDRAAADVTERFAEVVTHAADHHGGRTVKFMGDGVMFHFASPAPAVRCGLELVETTPRAGLPPAHVGLHRGPVVFRDGDYFGRTVNIAARVTGAAGSGEVLVTDEVRRGTGAEDVAFEPAGAAELKGLAEPVDVFRARRT
jgi:adenylate cyclase